MSTVVVRCGTKALVFQYLLKFSNLILDYNMNTMKAKTENCTIIFTSSSDLDILFRERILIIVKLVFVENR